VKRPSVDVIVPFAGSADALELLLSRLEQLRLRADDSLVVVDNRRSPEVARAPGPSHGQRAAGGRVRLIRAPELQSSYFARNRGAAEGVGEWLLFIDADVDPSADLVDAYFQPGIDDRTGVLAGRVIDVPTEDPANASLATWYASRRAFMSQDSTLEQPMPYAKTVNCAVRRSAFEDVGGFVSAIRSGGDADLCFRIGERGWQLERREAAAVVHHSRRTLPGLLRQVARHGSGAEWVRRRYPQFSPPRGWLRLSLSPLKTAGRVLRALVNRKRDIAILALMDSLTVWAFELGRLAPNEVSGGRLDSTPDPVATTTNGATASPSVRPRRSSADRRIAHAIHQYGAPSETFVRDAIDGLEALGWEAWIAALGSAKPDWYSFPRERLRLPPEHPPLPDRILNRATRRSEREFVSVSRIYARSLCAIRPALVHAQFGWTAAHSERAVRKLQVPFVATFHGTDLTVDATTPQWRHHYERVFDRLDHAIVVSRFLERQLRELGYAGPIEVIPTGVALERFPFRGPREVDGELRLLFVGRLIECKGLDVLLAAMPKLLADQSAHLTVVGDGPDEVKARALARALAVEDRVLFRSAQPHDEVVRELGLADVVVVPSRTMSNGQAEGASVVAKEALAIGTQLVVTDVGGLPESLPPSLRDEAVAGESPDALASAVLELWHGRARWPQRAAVGREWAEENFGWARLARRIADIYEAYLDGGRRRALP
jgi:glycosyltransferase involved in cell wall biosynthesis/GT2 family glycosyltransferase